MFAKVMKTDDKNAQSGFKPEYNVPMVLLLSSDWLAQAPDPTGGLYEIGCGWHARTRLRAMGMDNPMEASVGPNNHVLAKIDAAASTNLPPILYNYTDRDILLYSKWMKSV